MAYFFIRINGQFCIYAGSLLFRCLRYIFNVCNINMSCIFKILRFLSKGSLCALYVLIDIILVVVFSMALISPGGYAIIEMG